jgi:hypothetical protein
MIGGTEPTAGTTMLPHLARAARFALLLVPLAACGSLPYFGGGRSAHNHDGGSAAARLIFSPNGEPLSGGPLGHPACGEAMDRWFDRVDANHDGWIDRDEFLADARAQFARMDLDHDGNITSDELATFRAPFTAQPRAGGGRPPGTDADPVMSADANLDFKVSLAEFLRQADEIYSSLASAHGGGIGREDARRGCTRAEGGQSQQGQSQQGQSPQGHHRGQAPDQGQGYGR